MYPEIIQLSPRLELVQIGGRQSSLYKLSGDSWYVEIEGSATQFTGIVPDGGPAVRVGDTIDGYVIQEITCDVLEYYVRLS